MRTVIKAIWCKLEVPSHWIMPVVAVFLTQQGVVFWLAWPLGLVVAIMCGAVCRMRRLAREAREAAFDVECLEESVSR